jgi:hypothetical protein
MKKIIIAICILNASCKGPVTHVQPSAPGQEAAVNKEGSQPAIPSQNAGTVSSSREDKKVTTPERVEKKSVSARPSEQHEDAYHAPETQHSQPLKDSTGTDLPGGGSDIEGYIPFIKQFYDN